MRRTAALTLLASAVLAAPVFSVTAEPPAAAPTPPATQPTSRPVTPAVSDAGLAQRAAVAFGSGDYAAALPLLRRMADLYKDDPRKLQAINEQIRTAEREINNVVPVSPEARKPLAKPEPGGVLVLDNVKNLGNFEYDGEKGGGIPPDIKALSGSAVRLKGYMIPMDQAESISTFALVPSLFACCFGQPPQIQHTVVVRTPKGKAVSYYPDEITVEGVLKVEEKREEGFIISVFEMTASSVRPSTP